MKNRSRLAGSLWIQITLLALSTAHGGAAQAEDKPPRAISSGQSAPQPTENPCSVPLRRQWATAQEIEVAERNWSEGTKPVDLDQLAPELQPPAPVEQTEYLIGGTILHWEGPREEVLSPVRGKRGNSEPHQIRLGSVPAQTPEIGLQAYQAARQAWNYGDGEWPSMTMEQRAAHVRKFVERMKQVRNQLVPWVTWEISKSLDKLAAAEVDRTIKYVEDTLVELGKLIEKTKGFKKEGKELFSLKREPLGVVPVFAPYNYPLNETFTNLIPALLVGNTVVVKPAKWGTLLLRPLLEAFKDSFPPGVVNIVYGDRNLFRDVIEKEGGFEALGFIGSENAAKAILKANSQPQRTRPILGLGAKNMSIILNDADLGNAVKGNLEGCWSNSGQRCTGHKILFVQRQIYERFLGVFSKATDESKVAAPTTQGAVFTPSPDPGWTQRMDDLYRDAVQKGAQLVNLIGGRTANGFYSPTILVNVNSSMRIYHEEQFGTVLPIVLFDNLDEPIQWQMQSKFGQQVAIFGKDPKAIHYLTQRLKRKVGRININGPCKRSPDGIPFGARGDSGQGTLSLMDALMAYTTESVLSETLLDGPSILVNIEE